MIIMMIFNFSTLYFHKNIFHYFEDSLQIYKFYGFFFNLLIHGFI
jgi:hypothetical protein